MHTSNVVHDVETSSLPLEENTMRVPMLKGPPYHFECSIEAQEPNFGQPFSATCLGRLPPEIREMIYRLVLNTAAPYNYLARDIHIQAFGTWTGYGCDNQSLWSPAWRINSRNTFVGQKLPALQATYPPFATPYPRSQIALLVTCRDIHREAQPIFDPLEVKQGCRIH